MPDLLTSTSAYKPFRYPWAYEAWLLQQQVHWIPEEVPLHDDVSDWQKNITPSEKNLLTQIFRFFTQCYDGETEVLTPSGWCRFDQLPQGVPVAQVNDDHTTDFVTPLRYTKSPYVGPMYHWRDGLHRLDLLVTPHHKMTYRNFNIRVNDHRWQSTSAESFVPYQGMKIYRTAEKTTGLTELSLQDRLRIAFQADGYGPTGDGSRMGAPVYHFGFKKHRKIMRLENILLDLCAVYSTRRDDKDHTWFCIQPNIVMDKNFAWVDLDKVSSTWCRAFLDELYQWDGRLSVDAQGNGWFNYTNTNKAAADKVCAIATLAGYSFHFSPGIQPSNPTHNPVHKLSWTMYQDDGVDGQSIRRNSETIPFSGMVYCVTVPSGRILVRRNGCVAVCGNSDVEVNNCYMHFYTQIFKPTEVLMMLTAFSNMECFDRQTELLTGDGWKPVDHLAISDKVAQYDLLTNAISFIHPDRVVSYPYQGMMHHYQSRFTDICVTPNHELIIGNLRTGIVSKVKSLDNVGKRKYIYPTTGRRAMFSVDISAIDRLKIAVAADGVICTNYPSLIENKQYAVTIKLSKSGKIDLLLNIFTLLDMTPDWRPMQSGGYAVTFVMPGTDDITALKSLDFIHLETCTSERATIYLHEILNWDRVCATENRKYFYSNNKAAADKVQALAVLTGTSAILDNDRARRKARLSGGSTTTNAQPRYLVTISDRMWRTYPQRVEVPYNDEVFCVSVPTQNLVSRRNGRVAITGNTVHIAAYSHLLDTVGMPESEYSAFMQYKEMKDKYDYMQTFSVSSKHEIAKTMAGFGAFTEGLQLFASFAILLNFPRFGKMKGMGQIITWSVRDETLHCLSIIRLFHTFIDENPEIWTEQLRSEITEICRTIVNHEDAFIDLAFEQGPIEGLTPEEVKAYIRYIADRRLVQLNLPPIYDFEKNPLPWLDEMLNAIEHANFFENRATEYSRAATKGSWEDAFESRVFSTTMSHDDTLT